MENPATFEDVKTRSSLPLSDAKRPWVEAKLADAWEQLIVRIPSLAVRIQAGDVSRNLVVGILSEAVIRVVKNPNSIRSTGVDDGQVTIDTTVSSGRLYFLDEELELLTPRVVEAGIYSIPLDMPYWGR